MKVNKTPRASQRSAMESVLTPKPFVGRDYLEEKARVKAMPAYEDAKKKDKLGLGFGG